MGHPGVALRDLEASRDALSRGRYQPQPTERRLSCSHRVTFLTGANRDFPNWRRHECALGLPPKTKPDIRRTGEPVAQWTSPTKINNLSVELQYFDDISRPADGPRIGSRKYRKHRILANELGLVLTNAN